MAAYLIFPLIVLGTPIARAPRWLLATGIAASIAAMASWLHMAGLGGLGEDIPHFGLIRCLFEFGAGCMLCAYWRKSATSGAGLFYVAIAIGSAAAICWSLDSRAELWAFPAIAACTILAIAQASRNQAPSSALRPLVWLGEISYATYLSHFMLFIWFKIVLVEDGQNISAALIALFLLITLAASALLYHVVEKPGRTLSGRTLVARNRETRTA